MTIPSHIRVLGRLPWVQIIFDTPEGLCGEHMLFTLDGGSTVGRSSGCTAPALARPVRRPPAISNRGSRLLHPAPAGLRPLATERSAPNQSVHIGHQRSRRWPRRAIRAPKHTPYMTLPSCVSHRRHGQRGRPVLHCPLRLSLAANTKIALARRKFFRDGEPERGEK